MVIQASEVPKTIQAFAIALGYLPELHGNCLLLKTPQTLVAEHKEVNLELTREISRLGSFILLEGAMQERIALMVYGLIQQWTLVYTTGLFGKMCPLGQNCIWETSCFLCWTSSLYLRRELMPGTVNKVKTQTLGNQRLSGRNF